MALSVVSGVRYLLKPQDICIDNWIFKLHYRATVLILLTSSAIGVAKQYFGDPINCQTPTGVNSKVMDNYCWIHSTFHVRNEYQGNVGCILDTVLAKRSSIHLVSSETPDTAFYQWVPFSLVFQALVFYLPRKMWKSFEGGLMESFGKDAKKCILLQEDSQMDDLEAALYRESVAKKYANFFLATLHHNNAYFLQYFLCEILNFLVDLANIYFTDAFLGGRFLQYGTQVLKFYSHSHAIRRDLPNPMCTVFPTVTSCTFHSVGTAAGEQKVNSLCVLSLNIINEKIYLLLWFWFYMLTLVSGIHIVFRLFVILIPCTRNSLLFLRARMFAKTDRRIIKKVLHRCYIGDWWVLYQIGRNSSTHFFRYFIRYLDTNLGETSKRSLERRRKRMKLREEQEIYRRHKRRQDYEVGDGDDSEDDSNDEAGDEEEVDDINGTLRKRSRATNGTKNNDHHPRITLPYTV